MTPRPISITEQTTMQDAIALLQRHHIRHLPVTDGSTLVGMVTDRDLRKATPSLLSGIAMEDYQQVLIATHVARIMTREPETVDRETELSDAVQLMVEKKFGSLPVVEGDELVGILTEIDALKVLHAQLIGDPPE